MIDFIRLYYREKTDFESFILDSRNFERVNTVMEYHTGEVTYPYTTRLGIMDLGVSQKSGYVKNSLHKLHNFNTTGKEQNYDDFGYSKLCKTIDFLSKRVINASTTKLTQLEFGLNLEIDKLPESVVRRNFLMHKLLGGSSNTYQGKGELKQFSHKNYFIKVYDKRKQFDLEENVLRFEIKFIKAKEFQNLGIYNITDLKSKKNLQNLFQYLVKRFDELTIVDDFDEDTISDKEDYNHLSRYTKPNFWSEEIKGKHQQFKARHRKKFTSLLAKNDLLKTKVYLKDLLIQKFITLINQ
jgi:hypothetical protein